MSSPSNIQPSHAARPDFFCCEVRSRKRCGSGGGEDTAQTPTRSTPPAREESCARRAALRGSRLGDKNLAIKKRLFLIVTPRHYDLRQRDREGDARLVYSMDVPEIYGPVAHQLTFAEAARRSIICHYRVIISVVTSDMVN